MYFPWPHGDGRAGMQDCGIDLCFLQNDRVGSRTGINLLNNGLRKAVAMTRSMALLKDLVVHEATHVFFYAFGTINEW